MTQIPLLILSDSPTANTGLARICRDLATRIHAFLPDKFRVGTIGYAGVGSRHLEFPQYSIQSSVTTNGWYVPELKQVWEDFAGGERGVVLTIWDPSRMRWFVDPQHCPHPEIAAWLTAPPFERWGYFPVDASGPNSKLTASLCETIKGYGRILCYSEWAASIVGNTIGRHPIDSLPHGIDTSVFTPRDKGKARKHFRNIGFASLSDSSLLVGIVATNQARKDFALGLETCALLAENGDRDVRAWIHTDAIKRYWDLVALITDFGLLGRVLISIDNYTDEQMSWLYSACDVTLGIGLGEGFGFPIFESLACGVPVVHGNYGGAAEHLQVGLVSAEMYRKEGQFNCVRPVFDPRCWAACGSTMVGLPTQLPDYLDWNNLWPRWSDWLTKGAK